jgi:hypothetical protein
LFTHFFIGSLILFFEFFFFELPIYSDY